MKAITNHYSVEESAVKAFAAGTDVVLLPSDPLRALFALEQAVERGEISTAKVFSSARKILESKQWCDLVNLPNNWSPESITSEQIERIRRRPEDIPEISKQDQSLLALDAMKPALRWFGAREKVQSLKKFHQIAGFALVAEKDIPPATNFFRYLGQNYPKDCDFAFVDADASDDDIAELMDATKDAEAIVFAIFVRAEAERGSVSLAERFIETAPRLTNGKPSVAVLFGNPYVRETFPADAFLCTFSSSEPALGAAAFELVQSPE
jgi:beta-glucosidase-like glycosyl hydrolase